MSLIVRALDSPSMPSLTTQMAGGGVCVSEGVAVVVVGVPVKKQRGEQVCRAEWTMPMAR